jgi:capsular exopolysaccharide synthesis family protein
MIDHRFRYPEQISDELRLDILGAVPAVPKPGEAADPEATLQSIEAFRGLRMNMHHAFDAPPVMLTISSPGAGDGKSMISSNLALSFADAGYRTLLIDGDIRRGKLHNVFDLERRPGLLDYLAGDAEITETLRKVPMHAGLTIIPSGTRRHRGPELLTSARLPALLNWARGKYDVVLIDSAPLAAGVDAYALGVATGSMILIMRTGVTDRRVAKAKLKLMERMPIRMLGAVVNAVPAAGLYSEYSYLYGYQPDIDVDSPKTDPLPALQSVDPPR